MSLYFALLLSLALHAALIVAPTWLTAKQHAVAVPNIEARLIPLPAISAIAESISTEAPRSDPVSEPVANPPRSLQGASLRRAQAALSKHLLYPPQAVAMGLEGEVILLLVFTESGQLVSASVARSSGHALLDQAAIEAANYIGALPGSPRQTLFPVNFRLQ